MMTMPTFFKIHLPFTFVRKSTKSEGDGDFFKLSTQTKEVHQHLAYNLTTYSV